MYINSLLKALKWVLNSRFSLLFILFALWMYRVAFMSDSGQGLEKALQVITIFGMLFILLQYNCNIVPQTYLYSNWPLRSCVLLYTWGVLSTLWAYLPSFAFFLAFQNIVIIFLLFWLFGRCKSFEQAERTFLIASSLLLVFILISTRIDSPTFFVHHLSSGSSAALLFSYAIGEYISRNKKDRKRSKILKGCIILSLFIIITSTSSGANVSALVGLAVALFFSRKIYWTILIIFTAIALFLLQEQAEAFMFMLMPGKTMDIVETANGRDTLWELIIENAHIKPILGWGFACIERVVTDQGFDAVDSHNNYLGIYGSLGIVGCVFLFLHLSSMCLYSLKRIKHKGFLGIFAATCAAIVNGYSYGFLSGKASAITVMYFALVVLTFMYSRKLLLNGRDIK